MIPASTYRLQLHGEFPFEAAREVLPYLHRLGVDTAYLSPILLASPGSRHGYDICDHNRINPELGGEDGFVRLSDSLRERGMGCLLDFVPNHMGADPASNPWWWDVLENGPSSPYAAYFDIDWDPLKPDLKGKVLLPVLGDQYGRVLERGELRLEYEAGGLVLRYYEHRFPINPRMVPLVLEPEDPEADLPLAEFEAVEYLSILTSLRNLPAYFETDPRRIRERQREKEVARKRLADLLAHSAAAAAYVAERIRACNGEPGREGTFDKLHDLLERQTYRLAFWRTAGQEINYRRFFDINGLLGVRMENPEAFAATHALLSDLVHQGRVTGVRLDHVDGLLDPAGYLRDLRALLDGDREGPPAYIVVEKILTGQEVLRPDWPIEGTTGYEKLARLNGLFVAAEGVGKLERFYRRFTGWTGTFADEVRRCKRLILATSLGSELNVLANRLDRLSEADRNTRDFTLEALRDALREVIAAFPIYRTYGGTAGFAAEDVQAIDIALKSAARANPAMEASLWTFLRTALLPLEENDPHGPGVSLPLEHRLEFAAKFQQLTSPVHAKGVEDTAFYRRAWLLSLNEVGGEPDSHGVPVDEFHAGILRDLETFPHGMTASATHDTKRGEDARMRLNALSALPDEWRRLVGRLSRVTSTLPSPGDGDATVSREDEIFLFQSFVACWPLRADGEPQLPDGELRERLYAYWIKSAREAKVHTSWINPNEAYEQALARMLDGLLSGPGRRRFRSALFPFMQHCAALGALRSLSHAALKIALPGVPDIYQGTERWDLSLVDPDNRRPVDFRDRQWVQESLEPYVDTEAALAAADANPRDGAAGSPPSAVEPSRRDFALGLLTHWPDGRIKQYVLSRMLRWRRAHAELFRAGSYRPLAVEHTPATGWLAFAREPRQAEGSLRTEAQGILICCVRVRGPGKAGNPATGGYPAWSEAMEPETLRLPAEWADRTWTNLFTGTAFRALADGDSARLDLGVLGADFPIAWLWG